MLNNISDGKKSFKKRMADLRNNIVTTKDDMKEAIKLKVNPIQQVQLTVVSVITRTLSAKEFCKQD